MRATIMYVLRLQHAFGKGTGLLRVNAKLTAVVVLSFTNSAMHKPAGILFMKPERLSGVSY